MVLDRDAFAVNKNAQTTAKKEIF